MYKSFMLPPLAMAMLLCTACRQERTLYCDRNDAATFRLIPKHEPFSAVTDSISFYNRQTIHCLWNMAPQTGLAQHKAMLYGIAELRHNTPPSLPQLKQCYQLFRQAPCNDSLYRIYQNNLVTLEERLAEARRLYADVNDVAAKKNISNSDVSAALRKVSAYTHHHNGAFSKQ